jgi:hypothetical protein
MGLGHSPSIDLSNLQLYLDAANPRSYAGSGTTWSDLSGNGRNFTLVNGPYESYGYLGSMYFDGVDDHATSSYAPVFTGDFTISFWVNFKTYNTYQNVISSANNTGANLGFWVEFGTTRGFQLFSGISGSPGVLALDDNVVNVQSLAINTWHHVCITRSGSGTNNLKVYLNNVLIGQNTYTATIGVSTQNLMIAKYSYDYSSLLFNGYLSNLIIQHSAVTAETIAKNYAAGRGRFDAFYSSPLVTSGLVLSLDAGNPASYAGSGSTFTDLSGNSNNGTLVNSPSFSSANGGSLTFNGSNTYVDCGNAANLQIYQGTISAWVKASSSGNTSYRGIILKQNAWALFVLDNQLITYSWTTYGAQGTGKTIGDNAWHNVAMTFTTTNVGATNNANVYLDGVLVKTASVAHSSHAIPVTLGAGTNGASQILNGNIAQGLIYNRVLTQAELLQNFNALRGRFGL